MHLGSYATGRKALDELFPGKCTYADDNEIVFAANRDGATRGVVRVTKPGWWTVEIFGRHAGEVERVVEVAVADAR